MNKFEKTLQFISRQIQPGSPYYGQIYLVGGCVRDELLGERYKDLDLLINLPNGQREWVEYMCATYPETCHGPFYYQRYGTTAMDVIIDGSLTLVECVEPHVELYAEDGVTLLDTHFCSLEEDACRRDYTCNALYKNLHTGEVLDPTGSGRQDLKEGLLRTPGDPELIFRQDPVRMLRGIRFKHQKGFHFLPETWDAIVKHHEEMKDAAPKRVRDELNKIIKTKTLGEAFEDLYTCGLLPYIMPDLVEFIESDRCVPYLKDADCTIWQHTRQMLRDLTNYYPHSDTTTRLAVLTLHLAEMGSKKAATQFLLNSQIGKERTSSVIHLLDMLFRYRTFYQGGAYVARPRALPHFVKGLGRSVDAFRQLLRASNVGARDEYILPYDAFYTTRKGGSAPTPQAAPVRRPNGRENADIDGETSRTTPEKHRRNVRRREQRKRSRSRKRKEQGDAK